MSNDKNKTDGTTWTPPADWRPYTRGNPGEGRVKQLGEDGRFYSRPRTAEEAALWTQKKAQAVGGAGGVHLTAGRFGEGVREHIQTKEKFLAVMDAANLSDKAAQNLVGWLTEWRASAAQRQMASKQAALEKLEFEIAALRTVPKGR